jgi:hypothetical protein
MVVYDEVIRLYLQKINSELSKYGKRTSMKMIALAGPSH